MFVSRGKSQVDFLGYPSLIMISSTVSVCVDPSSSELVCSSSRGFLHVFLSLVSLSLVEKRVGGVSVRYWLGGGAWREWESVQSEDDHSTFAR